MKSKEEPREPILCERGKSTKEIQLKNMRNKRIKIEPTLNVQIAYNVNCYCQQNQEKFPAQHHLYFECTTRKFLFEWTYFYHNTV